MNEERQNYQKDQINSAEDEIKKFVAMKMMSAMEARDNLFFNIKFDTPKNQKIDAWKGFFTCFSSAYSATRHNIERSNRISGWVKDRKSKYDAFFLLKESINTINMKEGLALFDNFFIDDFLMEDLVRSGLYSLLQETAIGEEGFDAD